MYVLPCRFRSSTTGYALVSFALDTSMRMERQCDVCEYDRSLTLMSATRRLLYTITFRLPPDGRTEITPATQSLLRDVPCVLVRCTTVTNSRYFPSEMRVHREYDLCHESRNACSYCTLSSRTMNALLVRCPPIGENDLHHEVCDVCCDHTLPSHLLQTSPFKCDFIISCAAFTLALETITDLGSIANAQ